MDTQLVEKIVHEVKSQGVFDEFRKDSMADVDTKPAYQNLRQRVETTVKKFLSEQKWTPETNKNQLREKLRRHITESGFLDVGVERIVDQVVNPKIGSVFQPRIEEIAYNYLGLPPPPKKYEPPPPPLMHPLPPLPIAPPPLKVETCSLLPNDLEQVSPDSDKATVKSEIEGDDKTEVDMETDDKILDDEDESPPFEPLVTKEEYVKTKQDITIVKTEPGDFTLGDMFKKENEDSNFNIKVVLKEEVDSQESNNVTLEKGDKEVSHSMDCRVFQDSQLSCVSSDTRLSPETKEDSSLLRSSQEEAVTANISEEAQMPKFNENSSEPNSMNGCKKEKDSELHFDIKKDEIKFEGTERKTNVDSNSHESPLREEIKGPISAEINVREINKTDEFKFVSNNNSNMGPREDDGDRTPIADELSYGSSMENSTSISPENTDKITTNYKEKFMCMEQKSPRPITPKLQQTSTPTHTQTPTTTPTATPTPPPPFTQTQPPTPNPSPVSTQKTDRDQQNSRHSSSSSSSKHKKHSKERRRSHDREREKEGYRSSSSKDNKYRSSSGGKGGSSKHYSSSSTKNSSSSSSHHKSSSDKNKDKDLEKSSSWPYSSSKHSKHSSADKRHHSSAGTTHRDHSSSSSTTSTKRNERKDDHHEAKLKAQRRKSTDSNDDNDKGSGGARGIGGKTWSQHNKLGSTSSSRTKSKSSNEVNQSPSNNTNDTQKDQVLTESACVEESLMIPRLKNNVVFLNKILENPQTQFIELDIHGHMVGTPQTATQQNTTTALLNHTEDPTTITLRNNTSELLPKCPDLIYFEDMKATFMDRFNLLNETMDLCRRSVNSLRFDSPIDEGIELSSEDDYNRCSSASLNFVSASLKRKSKPNYEEFEKTPRKRCKPNKSEECPLKTSPSPSESSVNSKENEEIDKNTDQYKKLERNKAAAAAVQKLSQQQRYSSDDLYKPRPILGQRSRRRGMDSI